MLPNARKLLKLPFRRDSIEKVVRDSLRRGQTPNLQLLGQLGASLGLHVVGAKLPAALGVRMQTPALVNYEEGFALAVESTPPASTRQPKTWVGFGSGGEAK